MNYFNQNIMFNFIEEKNSLVLPSDNAKKYLLGII